MDETARGKVFDRQAHFDRATSGETFDLVIIGGGCSGVGTALDAAARGLKTILLEANDFGSGTSSRSTKLIHGGVRYLRQGNISLVRESLRERTRLLHNAPHLVHPLEFVIPCRTLVEAAYYSVGMKVYDTLAWSSAFRSSSYLHREQLERSLPGLARHTFRSGVAYFDGQFDDSRLLISMVQTAAQQGATLVNHANVVEVHKSQHGSLEAVTFRDAETGQTYRVSGRCFLNATGPYCDRLRKIDCESSSPLVSASQGIHLVLPRRFFPGSRAILVPETRDGRVMFIIPWHQHLLLGTTDTPIEWKEEEPNALPQEIDFLLETAKEYLATPPTRQDCLSVFAGIRPLVGKKSKASTASLSRDHVIVVSESKLITVTGGKWTTYRQMAEDCVDRVLEVLSLPSRRCTTHHLPLHGADFSTQQRLPPANASSQDESDKMGNEDWHRVYGSNWPAVEALCKQDVRLHEPLDPELPFLCAEVVWSARYEWARTVEDVLARRTRALFLHAKGALRAAPKVANLLARELGRDQDWEANQISNFSKLAQNYKI